MVTPASISASAVIVTYPGVGPSVCKKIFRVTPGVAAVGVPCADASVAINPVTAQIAHDATPAKSRRGRGMAFLPIIEDSPRVLAHTTMRVLVKTGKKVRRSI